MKFDHNHYVPCLRWKQGEYQAVLNLEQQTRNFITPLIEVPEQGFDFETQRANKSIDAHLAPFAKRIRTKWGVLPCFVDGLHLPPNLSMADGRHPMGFLFTELRAAQCETIPVTGPNRSSSYQQEVSRAVSLDGRGLCLRIGIEDAVKPHLRNAIDTILVTNHVKADECDFIFDVGSPNFDPVDGFARLIQSIMQRVPYINRWRTFTLLGTSFPPTMAGIPQGLNEIQRYEWTLYTILIENLLHAGLRIPTFGDYGISNPELLTMDMRLVKPSSTIRYTTDNGWLIIKGPNVRDNGFDQYREHCRTVMATRDYMGESFSDGDKYIAECANGSGSTGNLTTWRKVGTNHHLEKVARNVSSLFDI